MKKSSLFLSLIVLPISMTFLSACQQSDGVEHLDLSRAEEISRKVHDVSQTSAVLARHDSYSYTWDLVGNPEYKKEYHYVDKEWIYKEWEKDGLVSNQYLYYPADRLIIESTWYYSITISVNIEDELSEDKPIFIANFDEFFTPDKDIPVALYIKDGLLYYETQFSKEYGEEYYQKYKGESLGDGYVTTRLIADAKTYESYELTTTIHKDGKETLFFQEKIEYDVLPRSGAFVLDTFFHRESERYTNITIHVNPGSEHTFDVVFKVPTYTNISFTHKGSAGVDYVYFYDAECQTLYHWNRYDDYEAYVFTNPTEEQINKYQELLQEIAAGNTGK